ncbi:hypothetical protein [Streptomyces chartreusis]|uniref:hypothetical protein n=1 Tax=Streptomyces chartreusis TaxID=1969 RepID=UPI0035E37303
MTTDDTPDPTTGLQRQRNPVTGRFTRSMTTVRRDARAADLFADGLNFQQIADELGYSHRSDAQKGIERAKADVARPAVTKLIDAESQELDALYTEAVAILQRHHVTVSHGKVITWLNPETGVEEPLQDDGPKLAAIQTALRVRESYRKLHGLNQPEQVAVSGGVKYEVVGINAEDLT